MPDIKLTFEEFYDQNYMKLFYYIKNKLGNKEESEDLVQNIFLYCYKNFDKYSSSKSSYSTWLYVVANSRLKNYYRDAKISIDFDAIENVIPTDCISDIEQAMYLDSMKTVLSAAIEELPINQREVVIRKYFFSQSHSEIAEDLGISTVNSRVLLNRALEKLGELLKDFR